MLSNEGGKRVERLMTIEDVASYLRFPPETIRSMARAGRIPAVKAGRVWRFRFREIDAWLETHRNRAPLPSQEVSGED